MPRSKKEVVLSDGLFWSLYDAHGHFHQQGHDDHQGGDDEAVEHGPDAGLLHAGKGGVQTDGCQGADHQELAELLGRAHNPGRDGQDAGHQSHGQKTQNEPGEDLCDAEVGFQPAAVLLDSQSFFALDVQLDEGEGDDRGDDGQGPGQLHHGGKVTGSLGEGVARGHHGGGVVDGSAGPDAEGLVTHAQGPAHDGEQHDHGHVEQEGGGHGVGDVIIIGLDGGGDGSDGTAAADAGAGGDQVAELPVQAQSPADEVAAAEAGQQGEDHHRQAQPSHVEDGGDVQRQDQQDDGEFQHLFGGEFQARGQRAHAGGKVVHQHAQEHGDDGGADEVDGQQAFQPAGSQSDDHGSGKARQDFGQFHGNFSLFVFLD